MGLLKSFKNLLGVTPVNIGELNKRATKPTQSTTPIQPKPLQDKIEVTSEYEKIKALLDEGCPIVFVSGKAGTGKSTLIRYLQTVLCKKIVVVAPTGVAALNVHGVTFHSFFRFPPRVITSDDIQTVTDRRLYSKLELLIIDEISMVRADMMDGIDKFLRINGRDPQKPFGGVHRPLPAYCNLRWRDRTSPGTGSRSSS
jgi:predicted ATP-dependent serine protease